VDQMENKAVGLAVKPAVPVTKIVGEIISRSMGKHLSVVQVKNGTQWQSYSLHDSNIVYCELERPQVGSVVRFQPSGQPKKDTMLPFAYRAEVFTNIESLWRKDAKNSTTEEKQIHDAILDFAEVAGIVMSPTPNGDIRTSSTAPQTPTVDCGTFSDTASDTTVPTAKAAQS
jgi:hypothetical protein